VLSVYLDTLTAIIKIRVPEIDPKILIKCDVFCQSAGVTIHWECTLWSFGSNKINILSLLSIKN